MPMSKKKESNLPKRVPRKTDLTRAKRILRAHLPALRERYAITSLGVFGSYVHGEQKKKSDLDLLVEFERAPSLFKYVELEDHLSDLVGIKVDLVMKKTLKPHIGRYILAEVVPLRAVSASTPIICKTSWTTPRKPCVLCKASVSTTWATTKKKSLRSSRRWRLLAKRRCIYPSPCATSIRQFPGSRSPGCVTK